jgi:aminoglycoside-2''-adenylyltransferase
MADRKVPAMSVYGLTYSAGYPLVSPAADDVDFYRRYGPWATVRPDQVHEILAGFDRPWWVAGGWAIDAFAGTSRAHEDVDVSIFRSDISLLRDAVADRFHMWSAGSDGLRPLDGRNPAPHPAADQVWIREHALAPWLIDVVLNADVRGNWLSRRDPLFVRPLDEVTWLADGIRYLLPELVLTFKARLARPKDEVDFERAWPLFGRSQRRILRDYLAEKHPQHRWRATTG